MVCDEHYVFLLLYDNRRAQVSRMLIRAVLVLLFLYFEGDIFSVFVPVKC